MPECTLVRVHTRVCPCVQTAGAHSTRTGIQRPVVSVLQGLLPRPVTPTVCPCRSWLLVTLQQLLLPGLSCPTGSPQSFPGDCLVVPNLWHKLQACHLQRGASHCPELTEHAEGAFPGEEQ